MGFRARPCAVYLSLVLCCVPVSAAADPFHHQPIPLGERALGMGGAFTGLADDPSAAFYNPAGLAQIEDSALSASLTLNAFDRREVKDGYRTPIGRADLAHRTQPTLPLFVSLVKQLGRRSEDGKRRHAIAISTFTRDQRRLLFDAELRATPPGGAPVIDTFSVDHEESTIWHGLSYAYRLSGELAIGMSAFLDLNRMRHAEEQLGVRVGMVNPDFGTYENPTVALQSRLTQSNVKNLLGRIGVLYAPSPQLCFGAMFQPPSLHLHGQASVRERRLSSDTIAMPAYGTYFDDEQKNLQARAPSPWELRAGASYRPTESFALAADGSVYGATGSARHPVVAIGGRAPDPETGGAVTAGDLLVTEWHRKMTANAALGAEGVISGAVVIRGGVFTDFSAAPSLPRSSSVYGPADIDRFGATLSVGILAGGYDLGLGAAGLLGAGHAFAYNTDQAAGDTYLRTRATDQTVFVFISGAKRALSKLAKAAYKSIKERREERGAGSDANAAPKLAPPAAEPSEPARVGTP